MMLWCNAAFALIRDRSIAQYHHTAWTARDGAPSQVSALAQTKDGYLWIGSTRGLFRFDGVTFEPYSPPEGVTLPSHNIYALAATPDGGLWVSFRPSGLGFIKDGQALMFSRPEELPPSPVYVLICDHEGRVWGGSHDGLLLFDGKRWTAVGAGLDFPAERIRALFVDRDGTLWVATETTIVFLRRGSKTFQPTGAKASNATSFAQTRNGDIWIGGETGTHKIVLDGQAQVLDRLLVALNPADLIVDRDNGMWIANPVRGLRRLRFPERVPNRVVSDDESLLERYDEKEGLTSNVATVLFEDREGSIWVGTAAGIDRFRYSHLVPVKLPSNLQRLTLVAGDHADLWASSALGGVRIHVIGETMSAVAASLASSVYRGRRGEIWWGGRGGLVRQRGATFTRFPQPGNVPEDFIWEVVGSDDGGLWAGLGDVGLVHFKDGVWDGRLPPAGLLTRVPSATFEDDRGRIWFGYTENRVRVLDRGRVTAYTGADGIDVGRIRVIRGRGPQYWFGGELGLAMFDRGKFHAVLTDKGMRFGTVSGIIATADGSLWLNEMTGIVRIPAEEVRKVVADPRYGIHYQLFDFRDGLPGSPQMNFTVSTAVETTDGKLWFATDGGLARIDPSTLQTNRTPPHIDIQSVSSDRLRGRGVNPHFPIGTNEIEVHYAALSLAIPERVRFRYMLEGVDGHWQDAGNRREAFYTSMRPGHYTFRVKAANNDGIWNESGAAVTWDIPPAFYQTQWFLVLCLTVAAGLVWMAYRFRLRKLAERLQRVHDARLDERMQIARDLHDTLLQGFLSASMQLHVAAGHLPSDSPATPIVNNVLSLVSKINGEGRQTLRGLRGPESDELLEEALARTRSATAEVNEAGFRVIGEGRPRPLHPVVHDEIYRIGREAIANAFRHSGAENIEVELEYLDDRLRLVIRDDGQGIAQDVLQSGRDGHWGLAGMRERASQIGAELKVSTRNGAGTEIELAIAARRAYRRTASPYGVRALLGRFIGAPAVEKFRGW
jgi:signal transduction histidine kinase/ligand-binding sensor domain-containing protein